jgi:hypothetical protein
MATTGFTKKMRLYVPATGAGADLAWPIGTVEEDCTISGVSYIPAAAITGADTNTRTLSVQNKGAAGSGTTSVASLALASGVSAAAFDEKAVTLSATAANLDCTSGDVLAFLSTHAASGLADPGGVVEVTYSPRTA